MSIETMTRDELAALWSSRTQMDPSDYDAYFKALDAFLAPLPVVLELPPRERIGLVTR